ncbi:hypothetical protein [Nitrobacter sp. TKz-YC02]
MIAKRIATQGLRISWRVVIVRLTPIPGWSFKKEPIAAQREMPQKSR